MHVNRHTYYIDEDEVPTKESKEAKRFDSFEAAIEQVKYQQRVSGKKITAYTIKKLL
jgi:hypothetical protein